MRKLKYIFIGMFVASTNLFAYSSQNTINDPYQQLNRTLQYNNMNQQSNSRRPTNYLQQGSSAYGGSIQQPTYQQPAYQQTQYVSDGGSGGGLESLVLSLGILALMFLLL